MIIKHLNWSYKHNSKFILLFCFTVGLFYNCKKEIEIPLPKNDPQFVINCLFRPYYPLFAQSTSVSVKKSIGLLDSLDFPAVDDAIVKLYYRDSLVLDFSYLDTAQLYENNESYDFLPGMYHLEIEYDGDFINAYDILPEKIDLKKITILPFAGKNGDGNSFAKVNFIFDDPIEEINYYEIAITSDFLTAPYGLSTDFSGIISEAYYPTVLSIGQEDPESLPFSDNAFNGKEVSIPVFYVPGWHLINSSVQIHNITIHFRTISENYYNYKVSLLKQAYLTQNDIIYGQAEPLNVFTNIPQNFGIFAGYQSIDHTFSVFSNEIIEHEF